jgi:hypothetical protein
MLTPVAGFITIVVFITASSVYPSPSAFATIVAPIPVFAPGRFSITTLWPQISDNFCAVIRMLTSVGPPAGNGTTIRTGRFGKFAAGSADWAPATPSPASIANVIASARNQVLMVVLPVFARRRYALGGIKNEI